MAKAEWALNHPNIVTTYDNGADGGVDFIVMEFVAGRTLGAMIPSRGLRLEAILPVATPIASALAQAHSAGILHRDIKPSNIMVDQEGRMSPEQAEGKKLDARSDIFSFGAVLYEMATGQRAFQGDNQTMWDVRNALDELKEDSDSGRIAQASRKSSRRWWIPALASTLLVAAVGAWM